MAQLTHPDEIRKFRHDMNYYRSLARRAVKSRADTTDQELASRFYSISSASVQRYVRGALPAIEVALNILDRDRDE